MIGAEAESPPSSDLAVRILRSAERMFRSYGYGKTTIADIAGDVGISNAYIYRFYPSKLAICEAVCSEIMTRLTDVIWREARSTLDPEAKLRRIFVRIAEETLRLLFEEEKLIDIVRVGLNENWAAVARYKAEQIKVVRHVIDEGIAVGRFRERGDSQARATAVGAALLLCAHPVMLLEAIDEDPVARANAVANLVIDGLAKLSV
jgi:AcrR family transcriptional regulator